MKDDGVLAEMFSDADCAEEETDRKSVRGGLLMVERMFLGWLCKKQKCVALFTVESDLLAASREAAVIMGIIEMLEEIDVPNNSCSLLQVDNQAAISKIEGEDAFDLAKNSAVRYKLSTIWRK